MIGGGKTLVRISLTQAFVAGLVLITAAGAVTVGNITVGALQGRDREYFAGRVWCESSFDALSAACGAGLMMGDLSKYTPEARWALFGTGVAGALLHVLTLAAAIRRIIGLPAPARAANAAEADNTSTAVPSLDADHDPSAGVADPAATAGFTDGPSLGFISLSFLFVLSLLIVLVFAAARATCPTVTFAETAQLVGLAFVSLGCVPEPVDSGTAMMLAVVGWIGALGWPVWLGLIPRKRRGFGLPVPALRFALVYTLGLVLAAGVLALLERPRGGEAVGVARADVSNDPTLAAQPLGPRFGRSLVQSVSAATTGIPTEPIRDRGLRDGSKALIAGLAMLGGAGFGAAGGLGLLTFWIAFFGRAERTRRLGLLCILLLAAAWFATAVGLLAIESLVASRYQPTPSFADALLDAASAVGGGNLSSGLTSSLTSRSLVSGIGLGISQFIPGMMLLAAALLAGRIVPVWILDRMGRAK